MLLKFPNRLLAVVKNQLLTDRAILIANGFTLLLFIGFAIYIKLGVATFKSARTVARLFYKPEPIYDQLYLGLLTHVSAVLCSFAIAFCIFTACLIKTLQPHRKLDLFLLFPALIIGVFLVDDFLRLTLALYVLVRAPKDFTYVLYIILTITYVLLFWRRILSTPYILLLIMGALFGISATADMLFQPDDLLQKTLGEIVEESTKLLGIVNMVLYYWCVSRQEIMQVWNRLNRYQATEELMGNDGG